MTAGPEEGRSDDALASWGAEIEPEARALRSLIAARRLRPMCGIRYSIEGRSPSEPDLTQRTELAAALSAPLGDERWNRRDVVLVLLFDTYWQRRAFLTAVAAAFFGSK